MLQESRHPPLDMLRISKYYTHMYGKGQDLGGGSWQSPLAETREGEHEQFSRRLRLRQRPGSWHVKVLLLFLLCPLVNWFGLQ